MVSLLCSANLHHKRGDDVVWTLSHKISNSFTFNFACPRHSNSSGFLENKFTIFSSSSTVIFFRGYFCNIYKDILINKCQRALVQKIQWSWHKCNTGRFYECIWLLQLSCMHERKITLIFFGDRVFSQVISLVFSSCIVSIALFSRGVPRLLQDYQQFPSRLRNSLETARVKRAKRNDFAVITVGEVVAKLSQVVELSQRSRVSNIHRRAGDDL